MNKKNIIYISIIIFVIIVAGGYYFYKNPISENLFGDKNPKTNELENKECEGDECVIETNNIVDGTFQKAENNLLYFQPKDEDSERSVKIADEAVFTEAMLSESSEAIGEKDINLTDLNDGDPISVIIRYNNFTKEETIIKISRIIVEGAIGSADNKEIIDGIFQKIENGLLYFQPKEKDSARLVKIADGIVPIEATFSKSFENLGEKNINLTDLNDGDQISVFIGLDESGEDIVSKLIRITVLDSEG